MLGSAFFPGSDRLIQSLNKTGAEVDILGANNDNT